MTGILIMVTAVGTSIACLLMGVRRIHIMRGRTLRVSFSPPDAALNDNYAVVSVPVQAVLVVLFVLGLGVHLVAGAVI